MSYILDRAPRLDIRSFKKFFHVILSEATQRQEKLPEESLRIKFSLNGIEYSALFCMNYEYINMEEKEFFLSSFCLDWKDSEGNSRRQFIALAERESHLGLRSFYYFAPTQGNCRILYATTEGYLISRKAIRRAHYSSQHTKPPQSKKFGYYFQLFSLIDIEAKDPYRKRGKVYYRGKLTPYGKRLTKYNDKYEALLLSMADKIPSLSSQTKREAK